MFPEEPVLQTIKQPLKQRQNGILPPLNLLHKSYNSNRIPVHEVERLTKTLRRTFQDFQIDVAMGTVHCGPRILSFEVHPATGVKIQKIKALANDIALNMKAESIRIIAPIPGRNAVGIEIPNPYVESVTLHDLIYEFHDAGMALPFFLGKSVMGKPVITDLAKAPHCLIAGATGSGKSVCINSLISSILMTCTPDEVRFLMIDPKHVELTGYTALPHMIAPVVTEAREAQMALSWLVREMNRRYDVLRKEGLRNLIKKKRKGRRSETVFPYIVVIIDEFADLMMTSPSDIETPIARIAQMARAVGIHLILATQRPSREVITGLIKANIPTRIAFKVSSKINSQIILDEGGAEQLLGNGDLLFLPPGTSQLARAQGAYVSDEEIQNLTQHIRERRDTKYEISSFEDPASLGEDAQPKDNLYEQAKTLVIQTGNASTSYLQRKLRVGYARAASLIDELENNGIVSPPDGARARKVLQ